MRTFGKAWRRGLFCAAAAGVMALASAPAHADYYYTDLGGLPNFTSSSFATAISPNGKYIAGYSTSSGPSGTLYRPWLWTDGDTFDLGNVTGGSLYFNIAGVNDSGQVVGTDYYSGSNPHTFITSVGGGTHSVDSLGSYVEAFGINDSGQVVGEADNHAFVWTPGSGPGSGEQVLPNLPNGGGGTQTGYAINNAGEVTGWDYVSVPHSGTHPQAFFWSPTGGMAAIPFPNGAFQAQGKAISQSGEVAGFSINVPPNTPVTPFIWSKTSGTGDGASLGQVDMATGINSQGVVIGNDGGLSGLSSSEAFIWDSNSPGSGASLLNSVTTENVLNLRTATAIDDAGQIIGFGTDSAGAIHAYLLSPPGSLPGNPLLPPGNTSPYTFTFATTGVAVTYIDPAYATGYDFTLDPSSPLIATALFPTLPGDADGYDVFALTDLVHPLFTGVLGGETIDFTTLPGYGGGIDGFALRGIDLGAAVDPNNPLGFVTGLSFTSAGTVDLTQTPITGGGAAVPEPDAWLMTLLGLAGLGAAARARRRAPAIAAS
jgi:hypothetical protein